MRTVLGSKLGDDVAEDLMDSLPPFDWTRIATKDDLHVIEGRLDDIDQRFDNIDRRLDNIDRRFDLLEQRMSVTMLKMSIGSTLVSIAAISGLSTLLG
jgi:tetrahydromethanopterin S-methyltransferase subunit G